MARPIVIEFAANVRDFLRGTRDVERATEDIADELKDAGRDAERFEREFQDSMRDAERAADKASRNIERDFDKVPDQMGEIGKEGSQEFRQNLAEGLSSGNIEDVVQDTLGGLVSGLSGVAAGAATVVAGVGLLVFKGIQEQAERVQALVDSAVAGIDAMYDVADQRWTQAKENQRVADFIEENKEAFAEMRPVIEELGFAYDEFVAAIAAGSGESDAYEATLRRIVEEEEQRLANGSKLTEGESKRLRQAQLLLAEYGGINDAAREQYRIQQGAFGAYNTYLQMTGQAADNWQATRNWAKAAREEIENMPTRVQVALDFYATGPGAAYINPNSSSYSPGHVAIGNMYVQQARGGMSP